MTRKEIVVVISKRLKQIRESLNYNRKRIAQLKYMFESKKLYVIKDSEEVMVFNLN